MIKLRVLLLLLCFSAAAPFVAGQAESPVAADMRFVSELRKRGDTALALEYLQRLSKNAPADLAKELPFEIARTRLVMGSEEPESGKRLSLYLQARTEFTDWLGKNADSPRAAEARLEIAHVTELQGKSQLSKALTQETLEARVAEGLAARRTLLEAGKELEAVSKEIDAQLKKTPETDKARRKKLEIDLLQAQLSQALNVFAQSETFLNTGSNEELRKRSDVVDIAANMLESVSNDNSTLGWQAIAWLGRCQQVNGKPKDARKTLDKLMSIKETPANASALTDAHRLARYFLMLVIHDPDSGEKDRDAILVAEGRKWLKDYANRRNTPEGYGVRFLLAESLQRQAENAPKTVSADAKAKTLDEARLLLQEVEHGENEYTDRARSLKISLIERQGGFKAPLEQLKTFDECYVRSQYEMYMITADLKGVTDAKESEAKIKARRLAATKALELSLTKPDAKPTAGGKFSFDVNNARMLLAYHYLNSGRSRDAIKLAEELARQDIRASQAPTAAAYAMQGYAQYLAEREQKVASKDELKPDRDKLLAFAKFAEEAWPNELPANLARHQVGLMLLRDQQLGEAIKKLETVTASYPSYALVKYAIAEACFSAEKEKVPPLKDMGSYYDIAVKALFGIPDSVLGSGDPSVNHIFFISRIRIGQEYFKAKKYAEMEKLAVPLLAKVETVSLALDKDRSAQLQKDIKNSLTDLVIYGRFGLADTEFKEKHYAKVLELLMPTIADVNADKLPQMKNNPQLSNSLLSLALKSSAQLNDVAQTKSVLAAMVKLSGDGEGNKNLLLQLADLIQTQLDQLKAGGDKAVLDAAKKSYKQILDGVIVTQKDKSPEVAYLIAKNYSALELHERAADVLKEVPEPKKTDKKEEDDKAERVYHTVRAAYIHELRRSGQKDEATKLLDASMAVGADKKPGWGASNVEIQLERVLQLEEDGKFGTAATISDQWVNKLKAKSESDVQVREKYLEFYYHTAYSLYKYGGSIKDKDKAKGEGYIKKAATQIVDLEKAWKATGGFGSDASTRRIQQLLDKEAELKAQVELLRKKP